MLTTNQSTRTEQPLQGILTPKYESKANSDLPEKSNFSKLLSSMQLETASEASVTVSPVDASTLKVKGSEDVALSVMQQLSTLELASNHADSKLSAEFGLHEPKGVPLSVMQQLPVASATSNHADSNLPTALGLNESKGVALSIMQQLPASAAASNNADSKLSAALGLNESKGVALSAMQQLPVSAAASNHIGSKLSDALNLHDSEGIPLSVMQQLPVASATSNHADSNLPAALGLNESEDMPLSVMQQLPASAAASNHAELSLHDSEDVTLSVMQQPPVSDATSNQADSNLSAELSLHDSEDVPLSVMQQWPISETASNQADSNLSAELSLNDSDAPLMATDEMANPLTTPVIDGAEVKADSGVLKPSLVASDKTAKDAELVDDVVLQNIALNPSSVGKEASASVQLNSGISNAASNSVTNWGTQTHTAMAGVSGGDAQAGAQQSQTFSQGGQNGQNSQGQAGQQQAMMFAQFVKEGKAQALEQQTAVRALDESTLKSEVKDVLGGAGISSTDNRGPLPLGLQSIPQPLKHPQWGQALGQRVVFMANNSMQQAQITLNPEKLGHIQVTLELDKDQKMNVSLNAQNGLTRESMENALPKLREMLEQAGLTLGSMDVGDQKQSSDDDSDKSTSKGVASNNAVEEEDTIIESTLSTVKTTDNIVDYYA